MRHMSNFDKSFRNHQRFFWIFFSVVLALIVSYLIALGVITYKAASTVAAQDWSGGIKPVIEQIWCGAPGCLK